MSMFVLQEVEPTTSVVKYIYIKMSRLSKNVLYRMFFSFIDIVLITPDLEADLMSIKINEERKFIMTNILKKNPAYGRHRIS